MNSVSVIVPARDAAATLGATLAGLAGQQGVDDGFEVIVVDDGSTDDTRALAAASPVVTMVLDGGGNGPARARNVGAQAASGSVLAFLDSDCRPTPRWLAAGLSAVESADFVQGAVRPQPDERIGPFDRTLWVTAAWGLYESANLFVRRSLFDGLGGFESWIAPERGIELGEDVWLGWRARRSGARMGFCADALAYHAVFPRDAGAFVAEHARRRYFPRMAARIPELRSVFFYRHWFLSRRTAAFDAMLAGVVVSRLTASRLPLLLAAPYVAELRRSARAVDPAQRVPVVVAGIAADVVGAAALARGSIESRTIVA